MSWEPFDFAQDMLRRMHNRFLIHLFFLVYHTRKNQRTSPPSNPHSSRPAVRRRFSPRLPSRRLTFCFRNIAGLPHHPPWTAEPVLNVLSLTKKTPPFRDSVQWWKEQFQTRFHGWSRKLIHEHIFACKRIFTIAFHFLNPEHDEGSILNYTPLMPTFDFQCNNCNAIFEKTIPFGSKTKPTCPTCTSKKTEKLLSVPSIRFKGSGFYKTDSRAPSSHATTAPTPQSTPTDTVKKATDSGKTDTSKK